MDTTTKLKDPIQDTKAGGVPEKVYAIRSGLKAVGFFFSKEEAEAEGKERFGVNNFTLMPMVRGEFE